MRIIRSSTFHLGYLLATALSLSIVPSASEAYTADQQSACTGDAFRLCMGAIPDVDRVTACMVANRSRLSPGCRAFFREDPVPVADAETPIRHRYRPHRIRRPVT